MKRNIPAVITAIILALTFGFTFTSCKKADQSAQVVTEEKKADASSKTENDKAADLKKEVDNASGFNFK
jgi:hypothetical protein